MKTTELITGRRIAVVLEPGDEVLEALATACVEHGVRQAYISVFLGAFRRVRFIASPTPVADPEPPLKASVEATWAEGIGSGSISFDEDTGDHAVHLHVSIGDKDDAARAYAGHVLEAETHYVTEVVIDEVLSPVMQRLPAAASHGIPCLVFG